MGHYVQEHSGIAAAGRLGLSSHLCVMSVWISDIRWVSIHCPDMVVYDRLLDESIADDLDIIRAATGEWSVGIVERKKDQPLEPKAIHILRVIGSLMGVFALRN